LPVTDSAYVERLAALTAPFGVSHTGVTSADVLSEARAAILQRIADGFDDGMKFTFKNPQRSTDPQLAVHGARSVFVAARPYLLPEPVEPSEPSQQPPRGRIARYAWVDHYGPLRQGLWAVAHQLRADGFKAVAYADDNSIVDRAVAHRAGLGWFGKNANLLVTGAGSYFVLGCVVTTALLPAADQAAADGCGSCRRCIDACPTGAIVADGVIDAGRCLAWVLQKPGIIPEPLRAAVGDRLYGCDDCQTACPPTVRLGPRVPAPTPVEPVRDRIEVLHLLDGSDHEVIQQWGRWYLADRDPRWVRRNALVVLGNVGDPDDPAVRRALADYRAHPDPVLRVHALWATERLGLEDC
jgi:epoxyqueuosine reductase